MASNMSKFLIDVPPPTISGFLHMGHVFSYCHMDFIARYHRQIKGEELVYPFCYDNNGLPTEKLAHQQGIKDQKDIIDFSHEQSLGYSLFFQQIEMGYSQHHYSTFSENAIKLAQKSFHDLVEKGYAYKAETEYFYCPKMKTSVSQNEIDANGCYERSGAKVEVRTGEGWFIKVKDQIPRIRQAVEQIVWQPEMYKHRLLRWLDDVKYDWSISRERKFGIPIPGEPEGIVFDTWHTSSLSPQLAWMGEDAHLAHQKEGIWEPSLQCPIFDVRFQAHDIIRTWALFTIIKSLYHNDQIPWKAIVISGHALDKDGHKISKSAGNYVPPQQYIEQYGAAGVRFWTAQNTIGTDTRCNPAVMDAGKRHVTKIKNAKRFLDMRPDTNTSERHEKEWSEMKQGIINAFEVHNYQEAGYLLFTYFWHHFCDNHIEESKKKPINGNLKRIFDEMMPFIEVFMPGIRFHLEKKDVPADVRAEGLPADGAGREA
jgi:valyl-tRNA synthetase